MSKAAHHERGAMKLGGQEQFYLEGQIAYAGPKDDDGMHVSYTARRSIRQKCSISSRMCERHDFV